MSAWWVWRKVVSMRRSVPGGDLESGAKDLGSHEFGHGSLGRDSFSYRTAVGWFADREDGGGMLNGGSK